MATPMTWRGLSCFESRSVLTTMQHSHPESDPSTMSSHFVLISLFRSSVSVNSLLRRNLRQPGGDLHGRNTLRYRSPDRKATQGWLYMKDRSSDRCLQTFVYQLRDPLTIPNTGDSIQRLTLSEIWMMPRQKMHEPRPSHGLPT
jgi:hypothetical protein